VPALLVSERRLRGRVSWTLVRRTGYLSARTIEPGWVEPATDPYRLKIVPIPDTASASRAVSQVAAATFARPVLARRQARRALQ
jgi:hypothetical protein